MDMFRIVLFLAVAIVGVVTGIQRGNMMIIFGGLILGGIGLFSAIAGKRKDKDGKET